MAAASNSSEWTVVDPLVPNDPSTASPLFGDVVLSDVVIECRDKKAFRAHKAVLALRSEVFFKMLTGGYVEARENRIKMHSHDSAVVEQLMRHFYGDRVTVVSWELLDLCDMYDVTDVKDMCRGRPFEDINLGNCCRTLQFAYLNHMDDLFDRAYDFYYRNKAQLVQTEDWQEMESDLKN
jgi:hypothetical protein